MTASQYQSVLTMTDKDLLSSAQSSLAWISIYPVHTSPHFVIAENNDFVSGLPNIVSSDLKKRLEPAWPA